MIIMVAFAVHFCYFCLCYPFLLAHQIDCCPSMKLEKLTMDRQFFHLPPFCPCAYLRYPPFSNPIKVRVEANDTASFCLILVLNQIVYLVYEGIIIKDQEYARNQKTLWNWKMIHYQPVFSLFLNFFRFSITEPFGDRNRAEVPRNLSWPTPTRKSFNDNCVFLPLPKTL